jgi:putative PEP-CTERM system integral membrane protein
MKKRFQNLLTLLKSPATLRALGYVLFWSWHLLYLLFLFVGFSTITLPLMIQGVWAGWIPAQFLGYVIPLYLVPLLAIGLALTRLRKQPLRLLLLGYGIEAPFLIINLVRVFALRQLTPAMWWVAGIVFVGMLTLLWYILFPPKMHENRIVQVLRQVGVVCFSLFALYVALFVAIYALPMGVVIITNALSGVWYFLTHPQQWLELFGVSAGLAISAVFGGYTATLLAGLPICLPIVAWRMARNQWLAWGRGRILAGGVSVLTVAVLVLAMWRTTQQPQRAAFAQLQTAPTSLAQAQQLQANAPTLRAGLLNAYLAKFRYASSQGEVLHISEFYANAFGGGEISDFAKMQKKWKWLQNTYEWLVSPVLYQPYAPIDSPELGEFAMPREAEESAELYQRFFDRPINQGEQTAVVSAVRSTWDAQQARLAWQAVDEREVHLDQQEISVVEHGDWAEVTLFEAYRNETFENQEVVYYFNLPESAALTGLWLSETPNRADAFEYVVAPRGAAQQVYQEQIVVRRDPALLEQIGPRQYRLRAFPVLPKTATFADMENRTSLLGGQMQVEAGSGLYLWMSYSVMGSPAGWALPQLAEKRNLFWDSHSQRILGGQSFSQDVWLPGYLPASRASQPQAHRTDFPNGQSVLALPVDGAPADPIFSPGTRFAVILDRSGSMEEQADAVKAALQELNTLPERGVTLDLYLTAAEVRGESASRLAWQTLKPEQLFAFGGQHPAELLTQFQSLVGSDSYTAILVLSDASGYELGESPVVVPSAEDLGAPLWFVHLGGLPLGYDDVTLESLQASGGGATDSLQNALANIALSQQATQPDHWRVQVDGYQWWTVPTTAVSQIAPQLTQSDSEFASLAARRLLVSEFQRRQAALTDLAVLDALHAIAVENHVVSPYSSMIVLVNEAQRERLKELSEQADRFEREVEEIGETLDPTLNGVPEPHEWALLALAGILLIGWYWRKRLFSSASPAGVYSQNG